MGTYVTILVLGLQALVWCVESLGLASMPVTTAETAPDDGVSVFIVAFYSLTRRWVNVLPSLASLYIDLRGLASG
jgi:hypothetical protein